MLCHLNSLCSFIEVKAVFLHFFIV
ncbi:UNVERIFIED_CONTAM: hypothetical protein NCL1_56740 [Trichonephila clavipes]